MKILLLTNYFPPDSGSAALLYKLLAEALTERGHDVSVVTSIPRYYTLGDRRVFKKLFMRETMDNYRVVRIIQPSFPRNIFILRGIDHFLSAVMLFIAALFTGKCDAILVYSPPLTLGITAYILRLLKRSIFVFNVQDLFPQSAIDLNVLRNNLLIKLFRRLERFIYRSADHITVHSSGNRNYITSWGIIEDKISVIHNCIDTDFIKPADKDRMFLKEHDINGKYVISFGGIMGYSQDLDTTLEAARMLQPVEEIVFLLVGDGPEKERLQHRAEELGLINVKFLPMLDQDQYRTLLISSDIGLVTLKKEVKTPVVPSKIVSLMSAGCPLIAALPLDGDAAELVIEANCGLCVQPENPEALKDAIMQIYSDNDLADSFSRDGRDYAVKTFSHVRVAEEYEALFNQLIG